MCVINSYMIKIDETHFRKVCSESNSMRQACATLGLHFNTFKDKAVKLGCYKTNQSGKGIVKNKPRKVLLKDVLNGKHPHYHTFKLKHRLFEEGLKENKCEQCGLDSWNGKHISCHLDHKDGNSYNHKLSNLQILCPNCHSQTNTFAGKNKGRG